MASVSNLKEERAHATTHSLPIVEHVETVDQLVDGVAALGYGAEVSHQRHVVALLWAVLSHITLHNGCMYPVETMVSYLTRSGLSVN